MMDSNETAYVAQWVTNLFGPFDPRVRIAAIFQAEKGPHTVYNGPNDQYNVGIAIPRSATEKWMVQKHLAHELVHCLIPNGLPGGRATVLEEGLAEHSAIYFLKREYTYILPNGQIYDWADSTEGEYREAYDLIEIVIAYEGLEEMRNSVRKMRAEVGLPFAEITEQHVEIYFSNTPLSLIQKLCERFHPHLM